jgi:hypothetical protein
VSPDPRQTKKPNGMTMLSGHVDDLEVGVGELTANVALLAHNVEANNRLRRALVITLIAFGVVALAALGYSGYTLRQVQTIATDNRSCNTPGDECFNQRIEVTVDSLGDEVSNRLSTSVDRLLVAIEIRDVLDAIKACDFNAPEESRLHNADCPAGTPVVPVGN